MLLALHEESVFTGASCPDPAENDFSCGLLFPELRNIRSHFRQDY